MTLFYYDCITIKRCFTDVISITRHFTTAVLYFSTFLLWRHFLMTTFDYEDIIFEIYSGVIVVKWYFTYM